MGLFAEPVGKLIHWYEPVGVKKVVQGRLSSLILRARNAYLKSIEVNIPFPWRNCNVAEISGITFAGDSKRLFIGLKSTTNLPRLPGFDLGTK